MQDGDMLRMATAGSRERRLRMMFINLKRIKIKEELKKKKFKKKGLIQKDTNKIKKKNKKRRGLT